MNQYGSLSAENDFPETSAGDTRSHRWRSALETIGREDMIGMSPGSVAS